MNKNALRVLVLAMTLGFPVLSWGQGYREASEDLGHNVSLTVGAEKYHWEENYQGAHLLDEDGVRGSIGITWSNFVEPQGGAVYRVYGKLYGGEVDYDGATMAGVPLQSRTRYVGFQGEGLGGYRFGGKVGGEIFSAFGLDTWQRNLQDGTDALGNAVTGYNENYLVINAKLGGSLFTRFDGWGFTLRAGVKQPLAVWEFVDQPFIYDNVTLRPSPRLSYFGSLDFVFGTRPRDAFTVSIYYDSYKFAHSKGVPLTADGFQVVDGGGNPLYVLQPDSKSYVYGATFSFGF